MQFTKISFWFSITMHSLRHTSRTSFSRSPPGRSSAGKSVIATNSHRSSVKERPSKRFARLFTNAYDPRVEMLRHLTRNNFAVLYPYPSQKSLPDVLSRRVHIYLDCGNPAVIHPLSFIYVLRPE